MLESLSTVSFYLCDIFWFGKAIGMKNRSVVAWRFREGLMKGHQQNFCCDGIDSYLDCAGGYMFRTVK